MQKFPINIIIYDGVCHLCNRSMRFIIKKDNYNLFWFIPFQSDNGVTICQMFDIEYMEPDSFVLISEQHSFVKSDAWVQILIRLDGGWRILGYLLKFVPRVIRDLVYDLIGRNRYQLFGKYETCKLDDELINRNTPTDIQIKALMDSFPSHKET